MRSALITLGIVFGMAGLAFAAGPAFEEVDTNGDGMITPSEAASVEGLDFQKADQNDDGALSRSEYEAATR